MNIPTTNHVSRVDLHVHSCFSKNAGDWLLKTLHANECHTRPRQVYDLALRRGMDFVTLSDHNTIDGALELAHLPNFFISEEITTRFPDSKAVLHVVALNINESVHNMCMHLRENVFDLTAYLRSQDVVHFIAHPFFRMGDRLTLDDFEKMLLLFNVFEVKNGGKQLYPDDLLLQILTELSPERLWDLAEKHHIDPIGPLPWSKSQVAGSDDHGGILIASLHTVCEKADSVMELLRLIAIGRCTAAGPGGTPLNVAHSILAVAYHHFKSSGHSGAAVLGWNFLGQLLDNANPQRTLSLPGRALMQLNDWLPLARRMALAKKPLYRLTADWLSLVRRRAEWRQCLQRGLDFKPENHLRLYQLNTHMAHRSLLRALSRCDKMTSWNIKSMARGLQDFVAFLSFAAPYLISLQTEQRDRPLMHQALCDFLPDHIQLKKKRILVLTTDNADRMATRRSLMQFLRNELAMGAELTVWGLDQAPAVLPHTRNFTPLGHFGNKPDYPIPPIMDIALALMETNFHIVYVHSIDVMSVLGLALANWLHKPVISRFPQALRAVQSSRTDHNQSKMLNAVLKVYFNQCEEVRASSVATLTQARKLGISSKRLRLVTKREPGKSAMLVPLAARVPDFQIIHC